MILKCGVAILVLLSLTASTYAQDEDLLDYGPYRGYALGEGILGVDYSHPRSSCLTFDPTTTPASQSYVRVSIVYSKSEYKQAFHIDQNAQASFLKVFSGSDDLHLGKETESSSTAFDIIVAAYSEADTDTIGHQPQWKAPYDSMVASGNARSIDTVRQQCGDRYIQSVFNERRLFLVIHVSAQQQSALTQFSGKTHGSVDISSIVSAENALGGDKNVISANQAGALQMEVFQEGLEDQNGNSLIPSIAALQINGVDGLGAIAAKLDNYLGQLKTTLKGQPVKYQLAAMPGLPDISSNNLPSVFNYLSRLKSDYSAASARRVNVDSLLNQADPRRQVFRQPAADNTLNTLKGDLSAYLGQVEMAHSDCSQSADAGSCNTLASKVPDPPQVIRVELPEYTALPQTQSNVLPPIPQGYLGSYIILLDGIPLTVGQNGLLVARSVSTLLDAGRMVKPNAKTLDLILPIRSAYVSFVELSIGSNSVTITNQDLANGSTGAASSLEILHADAQHPCKISVGPAKLITFADDACFTGAGRTLLALMQVNWASAATTLPSVPRIYWYPVNAEIHDCFGGVGTAPIATIETVFTGSGAFVYVVRQVHTLLFAPLAQAPVSAVAPVSIPIGGRGPVDILLKEFTSGLDPNSTWLARQSQASAALSGIQSAPAGMDACSPHIP